MEIPNEILVVPLKEKKPLIKNKRRALKILATLLSLCALTVFLYYFPAPTQFTFAHALPIGAALTLLFLTTLLISSFFLSVKKALLVASIVTATALVNKSRIITIVTYAICIPLLFVRRENKYPHSQNENE
jgi:hypothetical protein